MNAKRLFKRILFTDGSIIIEYGCPTPFDITCEGQALVLTFFRAAKRCDVFKAVVCFKFFRPVPMA
ncbi:MAG: hypothetical protein KKD44_10165 [Proteobacteria bacterium]|nr:hypothetical protein [Pseudomonadota bacterium]